MSNFQRTVRTTKLRGEAFDRICEENRIKFPGMVELLMDTLLEYVEREGELATPMKLVSKRDYERFEAWERAEDGKAAKRETA